MTYGIVIIGFEGLAESFRKAAEHIARGGFPHQQTEVVSIPMSNTVDARQLRLQTEQAITRANKGMGVLLLSDMDTGMAATLVDQAMDDSLSVEAVMAVTVPGLIKAMNLSDRGTPLREAVVSVRESAQKYLQAASSFSHAAPRG